MRAFRTIALALALAAPLPAAAVQPSEQLADPKLEQRAREVEIILQYGDLHCHAFASRCLIVHCYTVRSTLH